MGTSSRHGRVAEAFSAPGDEVERLMYGYSLMCCLPDGLAHQPSAGTGTVMRPDTLRDYAVHAGFAALDILGIEDDFSRFYRLRDPRPATRDPRPPRSFAYSPYALHTAGDLRSVYWVCEVPQDLNRLRRGPCGGGPTPAEPGVPAA